MSTNHKIIIAIVVIAAITLISREVYRWIEYRQTVKIIQTVQKDFDKQTNSINDMEKKINAVGKSFSDESKKIDNDFKQTSISNF
jgi:hypothetical protein